MSEEIKKVNYEQIDFEGLTPEKNPEWFNKDGSRKAVCEVKVTGNSETEVGVTGIALDKTEMSEIYVILMMGNITTALWQFNCRK